jgi:hypothetical protein
MKMGNEWREPDPSIYLGDELANNRIREALRGGKKEAPWMIYGMGTMVTMVRGQARACVHDKFWGVCPFDNSIFFAAVGSKAPSPEGVRNWAGPEIRPLLPLRRF